MSLMMKEDTLVRQQTAERNASVTPLIGRVFEVDFGVMAFQLSYESATTMTYSMVRGQQFGKKETVYYKSVEVRPDVYMITWQESDKTTATYVADFRKKTVYASITTPENESITLRGTLKQVNTTICHPNGAGCSLNESPYSFNGSIFSLNDRSHLIEYAKSFYNMSVENSLDNIRVRLM